MIACLLALSLAAAPNSSLARGAHLIANPSDKEDLKRGLQLLEAALDEGPYNHQDLVLLYEQLGVAYALLGRPTENEEDPALLAKARQMFTRLVTMEPLHVIPCNVSPKVTFLYWDVRKRVAASGLDLSWNRNAFATEALSVEVARYGAADVSSVGLFYRHHGEGLWTTLRVDLDESLAKFLLPAVETESGVTRELYAVGYDRAGNEVLQLASPLAPREITQKPDTRPRWYQRWWVWAISVAVVGAATATGIVLATRRLPASLPATFQTQ